MGLLFVVKGWGRLDYWTTGPLGQRFSVYLHRSTVKCRLLSPVHGVMMVKLKRLVLES